MDPAGYGDHRAQGPYYAPQVRINVPQNGSSVDNLHATQSNNALYQSNQMHHAGGPSYHTQQRVDSAPVDSHPGAVDDYSHGSTSNNGRPAPEKAAKPQAINNLLLLLNLAEEYFGAAYGEDSPSELGDYEADPDRFRKLIAMGLACLETVLEV